MTSFDENDAFGAASLSARAMAARPTPYLDGLNPAQREAVEQLDGPVLMLAGAGTGKTRALTARIVHLLNKGRARPNEILAVTFTNKAAREMKNRVAEMLNPDDGRSLRRNLEGMPWLGTFHSICVKLLRRHAELVGEEPPVRQETAMDDDTVIDEDPYDMGPVPLPPGATAQGGKAPTGLHLKSNFTILDTDDQLRLLKQLIAAEKIDDKRWPARLLAGIIDGWKNRALTPDNVPTADASAYDGKGVALYAQYQRRLLELNAVDFGDLLLHMVTIFQQHEDVLAQYQRWFRYILVDEYQDTNVAQYLWLRLLAGGHKNICCVGDDDQSIYGWRGAEVGNILRFEKDFPGAHVVRLEQNYRSTPHILAAASAVIAGNRGRLGKTLWTEAEEGEKLRLIGHWDGEEEARWIGDEIEAMQGGLGRYGERKNTRSTSSQQESDRLSKGGVVSQHSGGDIHEVNLERAETFTAAGRDNIPVPRGFALDEIAILVRASHQMRAFEDRFLTIGLPYRVIGGPRFYERMEIRDAMAYFRVVTSPDDDLAFERIVNTPKRGLGNVAQQKIQLTARQHGVSLVEGARRLLAKGGIGGKGAVQLRELIDGIDRWGRMMGEETHTDLAQIILDESGYTEMWQQDKTPEAPGRLENLKELVKALEKFENLQGFLEHVSLIMDNETEGDGAKVSIMTLHAAKGLEFPVVFLPGWEDGLFPSQRSMDESGVKGLEEERRLAYVGITRAEELCTISFASNRRLFGQWQSALPSRFIDELPEEHVEVLTPPGLYGGGYGAAAPRSDLHDAATDANVYNSPGWKRLQARSIERGAAQPRGASSVTIEATAVSSFEMGERVFHQKFGYGRITGMEGDKLEVAFEKAGVKKVVARFLSAEDDVPF